MKPFGFYAITAAVAFWASAQARSEDRPDVQIKVEEKSIDFTVGKDLVARYHFGPEVAKPYLWPVYGPGGRAVTRSWPMDPASAGSKDHVHQKSAWFCHGDVIPQGLPLKQKVKGVEGVDFWAEGPGRGRIVCTHVGTPQTKGGHGQIETRNEWRTADGTKILDERRRIQLVDFGEARLLIFDIDLHANAAPITFGDTKEGSFGIRINDAIREQTRKGKIENADGKVGELSCWGRQSAWCDYSGVIDVKAVGLAILDHPANPCRACWHSRAYGSIAANPFGRGHSGFPAMKGRTDLVKLAKGEHLRLRYGLLIHPGDAKEGKVADYYEQFAKLNGG